MLLNPSPDACCVVLPSFNALTTLSLGLFSLQTRVGTSLAYHLPGHPSSEAYSSAVLGPTPGDVIAPKAHLGDRVIDVDGRHL